jgi:SAM-dependent methyltransferase
MTNAESVHAARAALQTRPEYGVDGWGFVVGLLAGGFIGVVAGAGLVFTRAAGLGRIVGSVVLCAGAIALVPGLLGLLYVNVGKFRHRDRLLARVDWRGGEQILDVGTGGGLLLVGAAKLAPAGKAFGIDIWSAQDLSKNSDARAMRNAELEGVRDRVEIRSEDARRMSFPDEAFDVVVSMLCIHNIPSEAGQEEALREMVRVCKRGGSILLSDLANAERYAMVLRGLGLRVTVSRPFADTFPPQRIVEAQKPEH